MGAIVCKPEMLDGVAVNNKKLGVPVSELHTKLVGSPVCESTGVVLPQPVLPSSAIQVIA